MNIDYSQATQEIQSRHFFTQEEPLLPNFERFFSADPRFPFSIAYPQHLEPSYDNTEYLDTLYVTFGKGFGVIRSDLTRIMKPEDQHLLTSQIPLSTSPQIDARLEEVKNWGSIASFESKQPWQAKKGVQLARMGESGFQASRVAWNADNGRYGEWIVFQFQFKLWTIFRNSLLPCSSDDFNMILRSFRFLDEAFFHELGIRWSYDAQEKRADKEKET